MGHLAQFNYVFKASNLILNKYVSEIQLPGDGILPDLTEFLHRVLTWLGIVD
jgi:hypothetical protein